MKKFLPLMFSVFALVAMLQIQHMHAADKPHQSSDFMLQEMLEIQEMLEPKTKGFSAQDRAEYISLYKKQHNLLKEQTSLAKNQGTLSEEELQKLPMWMEELGESIAQLEDQMNAIANKYKNR